PASLLDHEKARGRVTAWPRASTAAAVSTVFVPGATVTGSGVTVTVAITWRTTSVAVAVALPDVAWMIVVPLFTAVARPDASIVATPGVSLDHVTCAFGTTLPLASRTVAV